jgi:DNA-binding CsgD family transcriptional regulator
MGGPGSGRKGSDGPTVMQLKVLHWVAYGYTTMDTAADLHINPKTVDLYLHELYKRLGARNRPHAVLLGHQQGLIPDTPPNRFAANS